MVHGEGRKKKMLAVFQLCLTEGQRDENVDVDGKFPRRRKWFEKSELEKSD